MTTSFLSHTLILPVIAYLAVTGPAPAEPEPPGENNPVIKGRFSADPAAIVHDNVVYLYVGRDEAAENATFYNLREWNIYSSANMVDWQRHAHALRATDFSWATGDAWAAHVAEKDGKFYWYTTVRHNNTHPGFAVGVAVSDSPTGPFVDARGTALITNDMTTQTPIDWDDIDPAVFVDDDGKAYLYWGNTILKWAKLADNMIELDGDIHVIDLPFFVEGPWVHKKGDWYYLSYSYQFPEKIAYAMSTSPEGPWHYKGIINELAGNCNTNHAAIVEYKGRDYFIYHNGSFQPSGGNYRRSVCIDYLHYNPDGTMKRVIMTTEGVEPAS